MRRIQTKQNKENYTKYSKTVSDWKSVRWEEQIFNAEFCVYGRDTVGASEWLLYVCKLI